MDVRRGIPARAHETFAVTDRFSTIELLGQGGMGRVYRAWDAEMGREVALKTLSNPDADIVRLKAEFRSLSDVLHPNLVELYELVVQPHQSFFTMELIDGVRLESWVRNEPAGPSAPDSVTLSSGAWPGPPPPSGADDRIAPSPPNFDRLVGALRQLAAGLAHLHSVKKVHRDIKPSNVMVSREGRVVLLDFGLAVECEGAPPSDRFAGTRAYMAPEQQRGEFVSPAADCYALGVLLYELLIGRLPFRGDRAQMLLAKQRLDAPRPASLCPVSPALDDLAMALLDPDPGRRPRARDIAALTRSWSRARLAPSPVAAPPDAQHFVGRAAELACIRKGFDRAVQGSTVVVTVRGPSGIGKSELCRRACAGLEESRAALVLRGRCLAQEIVPYKAFDGLIDSLSRIIGSMPLDEARSILPQDASALVRVFPSLLRAPAFANTDLAVEGEPREIRRSAFLALRELLRRLSSRQPLVLLVDDLQWADADSVLLFRELLGIPADLHALMILVHRSEDAERSSVLALFYKALAALPAGCVLDLEVGPLGGEDSVDLATRLLGDLTTHAVAIADEASGSPFFIGELARHALETEGGAPATRTGLAEVLALRMARLTDAEMRLLELAAVAAGPIRRSLLLAAAGRGEAGRPDVMRLARGALLRLTEVNEHAAIECYHDRVREAALRAVSPEALRELHLDLARSLNLDPDPDPEVLAHHYLGGGEALVAAQHAIVAAERAGRAFAFDRAVALYRLALEHGPAFRSDPLVHRGLAEALVNAGRGAEGAESFERAASLAARAGASALETIGLRRRAGEHYMRSGRLEAGLTALDAVLSAVGLRLPRTRAQELRRMLYWRTRVMLRGTSFRERTANEVPQMLLARVDALWAASSSVSMINHLLADALGVEFLFAALRAGEPSRIGRGLGYEASFLSILGGSFLERRAARLLEQMDDLALRFGTPYDRAWAAMAHGIAAWFRGAWEETLRCCDRAAEAYRDPRCKGTWWEIAICNAYALPALAYLGRIAELRERSLAALHAAEAHGDLFAGNTCRLGQQNLVWLIDDKPDEALAQADTAIAPFRSSRYLIPHYHYVFAGCQADLYRGDASAASARIEEDWPKLAATQLLRAQTVRAELNHLRGRAALALGAQGGPGAPKLLARAQHAAEALAAEQAPLGPSFSAALKSGLWLIRGDAARARSFLAVAETEFQRAGMQLYRAAAAHAGGFAAGGVDGKRKVDESLAWAAGQGIKNPPALFRMLLPACS